MRFLLDMGVSIEVAESLRRDGHDAVHLAEIGAARLTDREAIALAARERRVIITRDLDFPRLLSQLDADAPSVVLFRSARWAPTEVIERLRAVLAVSADALVEGAIAVVDPFRHRVRRLPISGEKSP